MSYVGAILYSRPPRGGSHNLWIKYTPENLSLIFSITCWSVNMSSTEVLPFVKQHKLKIKLSLCLTKHHAMETYGRVEVYTHALISALNGGEWWALLPGRFNPAERVPSNHCIGGWMGPRATLDAVAKRKNPCSYRWSNPDRSGRSLVTILTELSRLPPAVSFF
jgi:hypothetical protein